jgi:hypothetical protein
MFAELYTYQINCGSAGEADQSAATEFEAAGRSINFITMY